MSDVLRIENQIRCGIVLSGADRAAARSQAQRAESLGFDSLWVGDHIAFHVPIPDSLAMLAFAAGVTERITLGTSVYLLPLRHPTLIAKTTATVDLLSGGRLVLGVGVGGEFPPEFEAVGVPVAERGARADEAIGVVRRLWTEDGVAHAGKHFQFGAVTVAPKPHARAADLGRRSRAGGDPARGSSRRRLHLPHVRRRALSRQHRS